MMSNTVCLRTDFSSFDRSRPTCCVYCSLTMRCVSCLQETIFIDYWRGWVGGRVQYVNYWGCISPPLTNPDQHVVCIVLSRYVELVVCNKRTFINQPSCKLTLHHHRPPERGSTLFSQVLGRAPPPFPMLSRGVKGTETAGGGELRLMTRSLWWLCCA